MCWREGCRGRVLIFLRYRECVGVLLAGSKLFLPPPKGEGFSLFYFIGNVLERGVQGKDWGVVWSCAVLCGVVCDVVCDVVCGVVCGVIRCG